MHFVHVQTPVGRRSFVATPSTVPRARLGAHSLSVSLPRRSWSPLKGERALRGNQLVKLPALDRTLVPCGAACGELASLAAAGVVVTGPGCPHVAAVPLESLVTPDDWEWASVSARTKAWLTSKPAVSALLCTTRPDLLAFAAKQIADQDYSPLELVVVAHGFTAAQASAVLSQVPTGQVSVRVLHAAGEIPFGQALTLGAYACDGDVVTKVDDDDYYSPSHVSELVAARNFSSAELVGKALQYVFLEDINTSVRLDPRSSVSEPETFSTWVCGGTLMLPRTLGADVKWFDPLPRAVDRNIQDKVLARSGKIYRTHGLGYLYVRRSTGHTYATEWSKYLKGAIEQRLGLWDSPGFGQVATSGNAQVAA